MKTTEETKETTIQVCHGPVCSDLGSPHLASAFEAKGVKVVVSGCRSQCGNAPCVQVDESIIYEATAEKIDARLEELTIQKSTL